MSFKSIGERNRVSTPASGPSGVGQAGQAAGVGAAQALAGAGASPRASDAFSSARGADSGGASYVSQVPTSLRRGRPPGLEAKPALDVFGG